MDPLEKYILENSSPEDDLMSELQRKTHLHAVHPRMMSDHLQGKFLEMLTRMINPSRVLEIGTFTGYSALSIAAGLNGKAEIDTIEADEELEEISGHFFGRSRSGFRIRQHFGSALAVIPTLSGTYDMVFMDGDKREYSAYYEMLMGDNGTRPFVHNGTFIIADNILWYGKVVDQVRFHDPQTRGINEFNRMIRNDERVDNIILPLRDGINIIRIDNLDKDN